MMEIDDDNDDGDDDEEEGSERARGAGDVVRREGDADRAGRHARGEVLTKLAATLAAGDGASFEHCKQLAVAVQNARRLGGAEAAKRTAEAEKEAAATLAVRYGCGAGEDEREIALELLKHLEHAAMESVGEFCEGA